MYKIYDHGVTGKLWSLINQCHQNTVSSIVVNQTPSEWSPVCLLYTSDAADDMQCVDLGGRRIIKKVW